MLSPSRSRQRSLRLAFVGLVLFVFGAGSCLSPTELRLHVHTNVPCSDSAEWKGVAVYVGAPGPDLENKAPALTTTSCDAQGQVGSLVVVPSGSKDAEVGLQIVAGIDYRPEDCAAHHYQGCIVARRAVRFDAHNPLDLDVALTSDCIGFGCDATHTCVNGACSAAGIDDATDTDAGAQVRCGDNGVFCPTTGNVCCLSVDKDAGTSFGECKPSADCASTDIVLNCDDQTDCAGMADDAGHPAICLLSYQLIGPSNPFQPGIVSLSQCVVPSSKTPSLGLELCQTRLPCQNGAVICQASNGLPQNPLPGYYWCNDTF
jgi:hypothetical protein